MSLLTALLMSNPALEEVYFPGNYFLARENSRHFAPTPLVFPRNDVWATAARIPYWWRVISQICVVLLIGRVVGEIGFNTTNQTHFLDLGSERYLHGISTVVAQTSFRWETSGEVANCRLFSQANFFNGLNIATESTLKVKYSSILFFNSMLDEILQTRIMVKTSMKKWKNDKV